MKFHVYTVCYNEEYLLPAFLKHYEQADKIIVLDNESTDSSHEIIKNAGCEMRTFKTGDTLDDASFLSLKSSCWKESIGEADFVIIQDLDELLHFPKYPGDIRRGLLELQQNNITAAQCIGYTMVCSDKEFKAYRETGEPIVDHIKTGFVGDFMDRYAYDKVLLFNPNEITEPNFTIGNHRWQPVGNVRMAPDSLRPLLLHYKHIGEEWEFARRCLFRDRRSQNSRQKGWSRHYEMTDEKTREYIARIHSSPRVVDLSSVLKPLCFA